MEYRRLNITVQSAQGLKDVNHFSKMSVYVEVSIAGYPQSWQRTPVDKNSGTSPKWNHRMEFVVDEPYLTKPGLSLLFQIRTWSTFGPDKDVGAVTVPIHDLDSSSTAADRIVEYQVITPSGKPKGTLKFSYKFGDKFRHQPQPKRVEEPVTAGYGYGYGYAQRPKKNKMGMGGGFGLGLGAGLLGGLLVGEMASDIGESVAYADGYGDAMGDMADFDF
ncbi:protein SRC2 homolog isoform X2 [Salvia splendens]|uniref:protein SRC2 homolog isoform X2 n=1 Tax=Salvia splendens TaxID=180675 RepID=UPI001C258C61|nr:protein SRC2 homolog isoform X2 [Salvia splendens]